MLKYLIPLFLLLFIGTEINAQNPDILSQYQGRAKIELQKKDLDEKEFRNRLLKKGIDIDNIQPEQTGTLSKIIEEVIEELEEEKRQARILEGDFNGKLKDDSLLGSPIDYIVDSTNVIVPDSISEKLKSDNSIPISKIYGHEIFRTGNIKPILESSIGKIPDTYILGVGDQLTISIFGTSQFDAKFEIAQNGYIQPSGMSKIFLKGLNWRQAKKLLQRRFGQFYIFRPEQFALSLSEPRTITINIFGEVDHPGSFNLSAINTAFNALFAAGGPAESGSVRNIKIITNSEETILDIYELMTNPSKQFQYYLEDNSIIQIPVAQRIVSISGAIQRPLKYELKGGEGLKELITYAGGLAADAFKEIVQIRRFENGQQVLLDVNLQQLLDQNKNYRLQNGDSITIRSIKKEAANIVSIEGAVELPGDYSFQSTPSISSLIKKGRLTKIAQLDVAFLIRTNSNGTSKLIQLNLKDIIDHSGTSADLVLAPKDKLIVHTQSRYIDQSFIRVKGAVRDNIEHPFDPDSTITVQRAIILAGGLMPEATDFGYLIRTNPNNLSKKEYVRLDVKAALDSPNSASNVKLQPLDELVILAQSSYTNVATVSIKGAIRFPGEFQYDASLKLKDVLSLSGGFKREAAQNRIEVFRLEIDNNQPTKTSIAVLELDEQFNIIGSAADNFSLMPHDEIFVRTVPDFELQSFIQVEGEVLFPGEYALVKKNEPLSSIVQRAGGLTAEAFPEGATIYRNSQLVVTELKEVLRNENSKYNYILQKGDSIIIPKRTDLVTINISNTRINELYPSKFKMGKIGVAFQSGKSAKWYIKEYAAGFSESASRKRVTVEYPNGAIKGTKNLTIFRIFPKLEKGSIISVGAKHIKPNKVKRRLFKRKVKLNADAESGLYMPLKEESEPIKNNKALNN